jgi:hypothetical protein
MEMCSVKECDAGIVDMLWAAKRVTGMARMQNAGPAALSVEVSRIHRIVASVGNEGRRAD